MTSLSSSAPAKKTPSLLVSFLVVFGIVLGCSGTAYLTNWLLGPYVSRLHVYRHQTNTPGEICGDNFNNGPDPYADNFSYWTDAGENTDFTCQSQQTIMQLQKPPSSPFPEDTASLTYTEYTGGNNPLPSLSDIAAMGYSGFSVQASVTLLPNRHTTQSGMYLQLQTDNPLETLFFLVDSAGFWHIASYDVADYLNESEILGGMRQELASGPLLSKKTTISAPGRGRCEPRYDVFSD